jgi:ABC-type multidrug transport system ATPase subunit
MKNEALGAIKSALSAESLVLLRVDDLHFGYPQRSLFEAFSTTLVPGVTVVLGGDGAGKTTLLRLLAGDLAAQAGKLSIKGVFLHEQPTLYQQHVFWTDPHTQAHDQITALAYFELQRAIYPGFLPAGSHQMAEVTDGLSLAEHLAKPLYMLSTGSKRKVWLAAAFAAGATLTLLDDPFAALDKPSIRFVQQRLALWAAPDQASARACVLALYEPPADVALAQVITLGD